MRKYILILLFDAFITFLLSMIFIINKENLYSYIFLFLSNVFTIIPLFYFILSLMDLFLKRKIKFYFISLITPVAILIISLIIELFHNISGNPDFSTFFASFLNSYFRIILTMIGFGILIFIKGLKILIVKIKSVQVL
jgi:hypothetical protein